MPQNNLYTKAAVTPVAQPVEESILGVLVYFDFFHYPLTIGEIQQYRDHRGENGQLDRALAGLVGRKLIFRSGDFYSLQDNPLLAYRRREGNQRAGILLKKAIRAGRFLQQFPFVRAVGISGSLSKNYADVNADLDFFIITKPNRLWLARTIMHLFKKLTFLTGHQHYYCMNYYVDEQALLLEEQNIFTAIELKTLLPVSPEPAMQQLFDQNAWANDWFPHCPFRQSPVKKPVRKNFLKKSLEWLLHNRLGERLDNYFWKMTARRWKKKEAKDIRNDKGEPMGLITGKHFARSNPGAFQEKVLAAYEQKLYKLLQNPKWQSR